MLNKKILFVFLTYFSFIFFLESCSTLPPAAPLVHVDSAIRQAKLEHLTRWKIIGKIAAQTQQAAGSATLAWTQNQDHFYITLMGPLGSNGLTLTGSSREVDLKTANGQLFSASSPEQLLAQQWGFEVPVSFLRDWVRGLPAPGVKAQLQYDAYGRLVSLTQQGWQVQFLSYTRVAGIDLPVRMNIISSLLKVKIVVYEWKL